ncbi:histidine phosphatase family protein [Granulibacter bethesdensis]|uniref:Alpha-ribazole-5'-phosphate phosphatase n=1 Tax=Granulibacter bethesdensis (strain ATCC BAA-1260 / CGDNIH1) TaxID=391165 RepID=Q0BW35_GRABC|nr:histidine phosphatase family protein [Granulibacter bethesdensis]ABI60967.1 Alpha-ribazole-5'-phosphate phosphatase [Granulibacter bethesdensis CGDNIH1]APH50734.1 Alpha-ribazole-5'-phosphate phosphatase [Granulibacter bethesdensis]APH63429.1 Alpha-ribazole-5'-phosphate phosphatase [Granulibacter bethesdensis]
MQLALIRHTRPAIADGLCYGRLDVPLADDREETARTILAQLTDMRDAMIVSSPALRCQWLANWLADWLAGHIQPPGIMIDPRLQELDFGDWEGSRWDDIDRATLDDWAASPDDFTPPNGESIRTLRHRIDQIWAEWMRDRQNRIVVTHGGPLRILCALAAARPVDLSAPAPGFGSVTRVEEPPEFRTSESD